MAEVAEPGLGDLPSLGELLALLHRADAAFDQVAASYRIWRQEERASAARLAQVEQEKRRGAAISSFAFSDDSDRPVEVEEVLRVWRAEVMSARSTRAARATALTWSATATPGGRGMSETVRTATKGT
jgi:hypothetical protein